MSRNPRHCAYFSILMMLCAPALALERKASFDCGGPVEEETWAIWDGRVHQHLQQRFMKERLLEQGDVYALYDIQAFTHNLVAMARRCQRNDRLMEMARLVRTAYAVLEPGSLFSPGRRWICRGGSVCSSKNRLLDKEVMLNSLQFLGLASSLANSLATSNAQLGREEKQFIADTTQILVEHLLRWGDGNAIKKIRTAMAARPEDVNNATSTLFFTDGPLWLITIYAELAGILDAKKRKDLPLAKISDDNLLQLQEHAAVLLEFFSKRVSYRGSPNDRIGRAELADLDRGYWRLYAEHRYAGYEKEDKPVACVRNEEGGAVRQEVRVPADSVPLRSDTGWDISHARRLVHALDALERNLKAMKRSLALDEGELSPKRLQTAFANNLVSVVWNGDAARPLFSNYWSGANGWYRVAYGGLTGKCLEGEPPYGMSASFLTGGYITWARYNPTIGQLGKTLYTLISKTDEPHSSFIDKYYASMRASAGPQRQSLSQIMFYPSLVGISIK